MLVSGALTYAWWVKVRVVCLRQHIYDIRDDLFDYAAGHDCLDDEAYRETRKQLNAIAVGADLITIPVILYMLTHGHNERTLTKSENEAMQVRIDSSIEACVVRVLYYLKNETFTGVAFCQMMYLFRIGERIEEQAIRYWTLSDSPQVIEHYSERTEKDLLTKGHSLSPT